MKISVENNINMCSKYRYKSDTDYSEICDDLTSSHPYFECCKDGDKCNDILNLKSMHFISDESEIIEFKNDWDDQGDLVNLASIMKVEETEFADIANKKHIKTELTVENQQIKCNWLCGDYLENSEENICGVF